MIHNKNVLEPVLIVNRKFTHVYNAIYIYISDHIVHICIHKSLAYI